MASPAQAAIAQPVPQPTVGSRWRALAAWLCMALVLAGVVSALHPFYRFGINETGDSTMYLSAADSPMQGGHLTFDVVEPAGTPFTHYPPLYPLLLKLGRKIFGGFLRVAVVLDFLAWLGCCLGVYWFVSRYTPREWALAAVGLLLCSASVYYVHSLVGPDGAAVALMVATMCLVASYFRRPSTRTLVLCGVVLAVAILLRYVCVAFILAACLTLLCCARDSWQRRLRAAFLVGITGAAPLGCVLLFNVLSGGNLADRSIHLHLVTASAGTDLVDTLSAVFLPYRVPLRLRGAGLVLAALALTRIAMTKARIGEALRLTGIFLATYLGFLVVSISLFDAATSLDERILAPVALLMCVSFALAGCFLWQHGYWPGKIFAVGMLLSTMFFSGTHAFAFLKARAQSRSTASLQRKYHVLLPLIGALPPGAAIYSNEPFDLYLASGRHARTVPRVVGYTDLQPVSQNSVAAQISWMRNELVKTGGLVIYEYRPPDLWTAGLLPESELNARVPGLMLLQSSGGFAVYRIQR